jgi:hypothetical protein
LQIDNLTDLAGGPALENDNGPDAIEDLGAEHALQLLVDLLFVFFISLVHHSGLEAEPRASLRTSSSLV